VCTCGTTGRSPATGADCTSNEAPANIICLGCPPGQILTGTDTCTSCSSGQVASGINEACNDCDAGKYQSQSAATVYSCTECVAGKYGDKTGKSSESNACIECPKGRWSSSTGLGVSSGTPCTSCSTGTYSDKTEQVDATTCTPCVQGKYNDVEGQDAASDCKECTAGKYNTATGSTSISACQNCDVETFSVTVGSQSSNDCTDCPAGYNQAATGQADCDLNTCICPTFGGTPTTGTACLTKGAQKCATCPVGKLLSSGACNDCTSGKYQDENEYTDNSCKRCT